MSPYTTGAGAGASPSFEGFSSRAGSGAGASTSGREAALAESAAESVDGSSLRTLFTGIVFGLQPDALFVIVPALALPTKLAALAYILMFVFGTVAAMGSYTAFIGEACLPPPRLQEMHNADSWVATNPFLVCEGSCLMLIVRCNAVHLCCTQHWKCSVIGLYLTFLFFEY